MTTTAIVTTTNGRLTADSTLTIDGVVYPIPERAMVGGVFAPRRIIEALRDAGYRPVDYYNQREVPGGVEFEVEPAEPTMSVTAHLEQPM